MAAIAKAIYVDNARVVDDEEKKRILAEQASAKPSTSSSSSSTARKTKEEDKPEITKPEDVTVQEPEEQTLEVDTEIPAPQEQPRYVFSLEDQQRQLAEIRSQQWYSGETPNEVEILAQIKRIADVDYQEGHRLAKLYLEEKENGNYHETYGAANSDWIAKMQELGIEDPTNLSQGDIDYLYNFVSENGTVTASGSLSSARKYGAASVAAYNVNEFLKDYQATQGLLSEQDKLYTELAYWAALGYTDDEIKGKLDMSKYKGLYDAQEKTRNGQYTPTTAAIPALTSYGIDGMLFAIRNPDASKNDFFLDAVQGKLGRGVAPAVSPEEQARRTPGDKAWAPYATASTMHDEAMLFGVTWFDQKWLDEHYSEIAAGGDVEKQRAYGRIAKGLETADKADAETEKLKKHIEYALSMGVSPEEIFKDDLLDAEDYPTLKAMMDGQRTLNLVDIARPVDFDLYAWQKQAEQWYQERKGTVDNKDYTSEMDKGLGYSAPSYEGEASLDAEVEKNTSLTRDIMEWTYDATPSERSSISNRMPDGARMRAGVSTGISAGTGGRGEAYMASISEANQYGGTYYLNAVYAKKKAEHLLNKETKPVVDEFVAKWQEKGYFKDMTSEEVVNGFAQGTLAYPDDMEFQQDYSLLTNQFGDMETLSVLMSGSDIANEDAILNNIAAKFDNAEKLNERTDADASTSVMPMLHFMEQFIEYDYQRDFDSYGDWQYQLELGGRAWADVKNDIDQRKEANDLVIADIDSAIKQAQAQSWGVPQVILDNMQKAKDICEVDNRMIDYAKMQDEEWFADAVKAFDDAHAGASEGLNGFASASTEALLALFDQSASENEFLTVGTDVLRADENKLLAIACMTENERDTYKALFSENGKDAADEYFQLLEDNYMDNRRMAYRTMITDERTREHPVLMNTVAILSSPMKVAGVVEVARAVFTGDEINPNSEWFSFGQVIGQVRDTSSSMITEHFGEGTTAEKVAQFGYGIVTSVGDSLVAAPLGGAATMALESFADTAWQSTLAGGDKWDVILHAGVTGLAEWATEKIPMDNITKAFDGASLAKVFVGGLAEGPGEMLSELVGGVSEEYFMGALSQYNQAVEAYAAEMGPEEAERRARTEFWQRVGMAGLQGVVAGQAQGGVSYVGGNVLRSLNSIGGKGDQRGSVDQRGNAANAPSATAAETSSKTDAETANADIATNNADISTENADTANNTANTANNETTELTSDTTVAPESEVNEAVTAPAQEADASVRMVTALANAAKSGVSVGAKTSTVAGVYDAAGLDSDMGTAAAKSIASDANAMQNLLADMQNANGEDVETVLKAAAYKALANVPDAQNLSPAEIVAAVEGDASLKAQVDNAVMNSAIAEETVSILEGMDKSDFENAKRNADRTKNEKKKAQTELNNQNATLKAKRKQWQDAMAAFKEDVANRDKANRATNAAREMDEQQRVTDEAKAKAEAAETAYTEATKSLKELSRKKQNEARRDARERVEQRMAEKAAAMEQQKAAEEQVTPEVKSENVGNKNLASPTTQPSATEPAPVAQSSALDESTPTMTQQVDEAEVTPETVDMTDDVVQQEVEAMKNAPQESNKEWREKYKAKQKELESRRKYKAGIIKGVKNMVKMLTNPTKKKHVLSGLDTLVVDFLSAVDIGSAGTKPTTKLGEKINMLANAFANANNESAMAFDPDMIENMHTLAFETAELDGFGKLDTEQMADLYNMVKAVQHSVNQANKMFVSKRNATVDELTNRTANDLSSKKDQKHLEGFTRKVRDMFENGMADSFHFFDRLGSAAKEVFSSVREGLDKKTVNISNAIDFANTVAQGLPKEDMGKKPAKTDYVLDSGTISLSKAEVMELYNASRDPDGLRHILHGGIRTNDSSTVYRITEDELNEMFTRLSDTERNAAEQLQSYISEHGGELGNETSMNLYGYRKFTRPSYYPLHVDSNTTRTMETPEGNNASLYAIANLGITKERNQGAINPLVIGNAFDTFASYMDKITTYNAYAAPVIDMLRWFNGKDENGVPLKRILESKIGKDGMNYITTFISDLNGKTGRPYSPGISEEMMRNAKVAAMGANLRVAIQQPSAIARASLLMNPKFILKGILSTPNMIRRASTLAQNYSPIAKWKSLGFYEMNIGQPLRDMMFPEGETLKQKAVGLGMALPGKMDEMGFAMLWRACEAEVRSLNPDLHGEALYEATGKRLSEVIDYTQVVDTPLHRTQMGRSKSGTVQMSTAFMSEPMKTWNMLSSALSNVKENPKSKQARTVLARAVGAYASSSILNAVFQSLMDGVRADDDDEYWTNVAQAFIGEDGKTGNLVDGLNPLSMVPIVKDAMSMMQGYDPSRMDLQAIQKAIRVIKQIPKKADGTSTWNFYKWVREVGGALSYAFGVPADNLVRDSVALYNTFVAPTIGTEKIVARYAPETFSETAEKMYGAMMSGDASAWQKGNERMKGGDKPKNDSEIDTQIALAMANTDERTMLAYENKSMGRSASVAMYRDEMVEDILRAGVLTDQKRAQEIVDKAINNHKPPAVQEKDPDKQLNAKLYETKDAVNVLLAMADGEATAEDYALTVSELVADSTAKDPTKQVAKNIKSAVKEMYMQFYRDNGDSASLSNLDSVLAETLGIGQMELMGWRQQVDEE